MSNSLKFAHKSDGVGLRSPFSHAIDLRHQTDLRSNRQTLDDAALNACTRRPPFSCDLLGDNYSGTNIALIK
jgi:hypothetical protein